MGVTGLNRGITASHAQGVDSSRLGIGFPSLILVKESSKCLLLQPRCIRLFPSHSFIHLEAASFYVVSTNSIGSTSFQEEKGCETKAFFQKCFIRTSASNDQVSPGIEKIDRTIPRYSLQCLVLLRLSALVKALAETEAKLAAPEENNKSRLNEKKAKIKKEMEKMGGVRKYQDASVFDYTFRYWSAFGTPSNTK